MCGIVGIYNFDGSSVDPEILREMTEIQRHRGPDDQGIRLFSFRHRNSADQLDRRHPDRPHFEGGIGFNRLSILDLSANAHQPMCNEDGSIFIAFNGEIYNAFDYRSELQSAGFRFRSTSDTEIILYLYEHYGFLEMLKRLNGMFAICIVDTKRQEIYLVRDRLGIKPLYWYESGGTFLFSSEVKSFLFHPCFKAELDPDRIDEYFLFRYCAGNGFLMKGVRHLEPGHWIRLHPGGWKEHQYWKIPERSEKTLSFHSALEVLEERLQRSVELQLLSDVKIGCQLSGGIDSSLISLFAAGKSYAGMDAFSIVFDDAKLSERSWVEKAASTAKVASHKYQLDSGYFLNNLQKATWHLDQPISTPNSIGIFCLAQHARSSITVFLSGEGADELFGGYTRFLYAMLLPYMQNFMPALTLLPFAKKVAKKFEGLRHSDKVEWYILQSACQLRDQLVSLRPAIEFSRILGERRAIFGQGSGDYIDKCFSYELQTYLVDLLIRQDKMTMAHSMENRVPFLDHELVEFVRSLPHEYLLTTRPAFRQIRTRNTKVLLKKLALKYFSPEFVYRPKCGFSVPLQSYLNDSRFDTLMKDSLLPGMRSRGVVRSQVAETLWNRLRNGEDGNIVDSLWLCIAFEIWAQQYLDRKWPAIMSYPTAYQL